MKKYLLLAQPEEEFPEQFNSHMFLVIEAIFLAKKLGRVFVLPHIHSHPRNSTLCEQGETDHSKFVLGKIDYPFESIFNIEMLRQYIEVVTFAEFVRISENRLSCLYMFDKTHQKSINIYGEHFTFDNSAKLISIYEIPDTDAATIALTGCRRRQHTHKSSPNWHNDLAMDYWEIRTSLKYHDRYLVAADEFVKSHLGGSFVAVHWRRGDRVHPELGKDKENIIEDRKTMELMLEHYLVRPIQSLLRSYQLKTVFLATNSGTEWHLEYLKTRLPIVQFIPSGAIADMLGESMIEQMICVQSDFYFSSPYNYEKCSNFSRWIIDEKRINGTGKMVSYQKKMKPRSKLQLTIGMVIEIIKRGARQLGRRNGVVLYSRSRQLVFYALNHLKLIRRSWKKYGKNVDGKVSMHPTTRAALFDNRFVTITNESVEQSGSWSPYLDSMAIASDHELIRTLYQLLVLLPTPVLFDIGANTGSFSLLPSISPNITVYAFEPSPHSFDLLNQNLNLNDLGTKVSTFNVALGRTNGTTKLNIPDKKGHSGLATLGSPYRLGKSHAIQVPIITLDDFVRTHHMPSIDFIKIDTEGAELDVLHGGEQTIRKYMPTLLIESDAKTAQQCGHEPKETEDLLISWGYKITRINAANILCTEKR